MTTESTKLNVFNARLLALSWEAAVERDDDREAAVASTEEQRHDNRAIILYRVRNNYVTIDISVKKQTSTQRADVHLHSLFPGFSIINGVCNTLWFERFYDFKTGFLHIKC